MPNDLSSLLNWAAGYYHHPLGEVLAAAVPTLIRRGNQPKARQADRWALTEKGRAESGSVSPRARVQCALLAELQGGAAHRDSLSQIGSSWTSAIRRFVELGWVEALDPWSGSEEIAEGPELHPEQRAAISAIQGSAGRFCCHLLDGVTGSGKTEVYLRLIAQVIQTGGAALVLVPEIGLTPQLLHRFRTRLDARIAVMHSGLSDGERAMAWAAARDGLVNVVVGTRSSVFVPLASLQLIVVDEEHDLSFKQQDGFRYHARDLAIRRAQQAGCPIVLGTATPALESLAHARAGRYSHLRLTQRAGDAKPPRFAVLDVRKQRLREGLSEALLKLIGDVLTRGEQVLVFVNRRGYAPVLFCGNCGWHAECERCDANLTWHRQAHELRCHHCDHRRVVPAACPSCESEDLAALGEGTERVERLLQERFAAYPVLRADRDSTRRKGSFGAVLERARSGEPCVLVGTQMLAKGHDFPGVTLAVVVNVDQALFSSDFRAPERLAQLVVQVAGRAGRGSRPGAVALQTLQPDHALFRTLIDEGYPGLADQQLAERRAAELPPLTFLALLRAESKSAASTFEYLDDAAAALETLDVADVLGIGPMPAPMARRAGMIRGHLLLQSATRRSLHRALSKWVVKLESVKSGRRVRWSIDVDPQEML